MEAGLLKREAEVLGSGLSEGFSAIAATTWSDMKEAGNSFVDKPLSTTVDYLKNHWQDAAAGAVIALANPRGMVNAMLLAWSLRGVGEATGKAMLAAAAGGDLEAAKNELKDSISHEGTAFLAALPMAMVGSVAGRAGANAIFGKDLAAADLLAGRVSRAQVKENLWAIHDKVNPPKLKTLVTDLDGTTYPFHDYFAPAMREAVPQLAKKVGMTEAEVYKAIGKVMDNRRTHDWPWVLEESELASRFKGTPQQFRTEVVEPYHRLVDDHMHRYLKAYPEVLETLAVLKQRGVKIYALSDAPLFIAKTRAKVTGVAEHLDGLYALATPEPPVSAVGGMPQALEAGRQRVADLLGAPPPPREIHAVPKAFEKPETGGIMMVFAKDPQVRPSERLFTGDSRIKDGGVAERAGIRYVRARYGSIVPSEYEHIFSTLRPDFGVGGPTKAKVYPAQVGESATYADLLKFVDPRVDLLGVTRESLAALAVRPRLKALMAYDLFPGQHERH